ncbi:MAG: MarR family transcriptional regulator [Clostridiaceae bacterium]|nr:MarR family transcriptional regulator [Clostridiaceae bacterium]
MENVKRGIRQIDRTARIYTAKAVRHTGLNPAELQALRHITYHEGCNQRELTEDLGVDKAAVTRLAALLEKKGYVYREPDPEDGRSKLLRPTAVATALKSQLVSVETGFYSWLLSSLSEEEASAFAATLEKLRQRAMEERQAGFCHLREEGGDGPCI